MAIQDSKLIQNAQTKVSTGDYINVARVDTLIVHIFGDSTNFKVVFQGSLNTTDYFDICGTRLADSTMNLIKESSVLNEGWEFDVSGLATFRANLVSIDRGSISVMANSSM